MMNTIGKAMLKYGVSSGDTVYLLVDISGGMEVDRTQTDIHKLPAYLRALDNINLVVIEFDDRIESIKEYSSDNLNDLLDYMQVYGGGTFIETPLEAALNHKKNAKIADVSKLFIYSDGKFFVTLPAGVAESFTITTLVNTHNVNDISINEIRKIGGMVIL